MSTEASKELVRRLVDEVVNERNPDPLESIAADEFATLARRWVSPFQSAFPDFRVEIVELVAENDTVVGHFKCSGTHRARRRGRALQQEHLADTRASGTHARLRHHDDDLAAARSGIYDHRATPRAHERGE